MRRLLSVFLAGILFLDVISLGVIFFSGNNTVPEGDNNPVTEQEDMFSKASVVAVGDNILQTKILEQARARSNTGGYDFGYVYEKLAPVISAADVAVFTQESVVSAEHGVSGETLFNAPAEIGDEMAKVGFNAVNIATNHILDYGELGLVNTVNYWQDKDFCTIGAYAGKDSSDWLTIKDINGIRIAWYGFTQSTNGHSLPDDSDAVLDISTHETRIANMLDLASRKADVVIVCAHWGNEYEKEVTEEQRALAVKLGNWGADVIIGSHTHVLQEAEMIKNSDGSQTFVAYSLGNFLSAMPRKETMLGGLLSFDIVKNSETVQVSLENFKISGVVLHYGYDMSKIRIYPLSEYTESLAEVHGIRTKEEDFSSGYLNDMLTETIDSAYLN